MWYLLFFLGGILSSCEPRQQENAPVVLEQPLADTCDDPDAPMGCYFMQMPARLSSVVHISKPDEPGETLVISGRILEADGKTPAANVRMYLWQTNARGLYTRKGDETGVHKHHGYLHGWLQTDADGHYEIRTIRPAPYPNEKIAAHIHAVLWKSDGSKPFHISDFVFADDPLVNKEYLEGLKRWNMPGGDGVIKLQKHNNSWMGNRDIVLR